MTRSNSATALYENSSPDISEKVAFLSRAENLGGFAKSVEVNETHLSFVFLADLLVWKLKKPVRYHTMDFRSLAARKRNCEEEVRLNSRISPQVYVGIIPLVVKENGAFQLGGEGKVVDWLVKMRRLRAERMLDQAIIQKSFKDEDVIETGKLLADFYKKCERILVTPQEYRQQLRNDILAAENELLKADYELSAKQVHSIAIAQIAFLAKEEKLFDDRVFSRNIVDAHGDLRPEHICLNDPPAVIDCLEFDRELRILDPVSELSFLALECERIGNARIGELIFKTYLHKSGDRISQSLRNFYRSYHAFLRAKIAIWHLEDCGIADRKKWQTRAQEYLEFAEIIFSIS